MPGLLGYRMAASSVTRPQAALPYGVYHGVICHIAIEIETSGLIQEYKVLPSVPETDLLFLLLTTPS